MQLQTKIFYAAVFIFFFAVGGYVWRVTHSGERSISIKRPSFSSQNSNSIVVYVGEQAISNADIDFEYSLQTKGIFEAEDLTPVPDLGARFEQELLPLKERLMSELIERKMLYQYIKKDETFDIENPTRYSTCVNEWQDLQNKIKDLVTDAAGKDRLKQRLCEKDILLQYLKEKIFAVITVDEAEIVEYYKNHLNEFKKPERVLIRQIVLGNEKDAIKVRQGLTVNNFAERARAHSITPEAQEGGLLGPFARGSMPNIFDVAFTMRPHSIYGVLKSTYGFHLILLEKKIPKEELSLAQASPIIRAQILKKKQEHEYQKWVESAQNAILIKMQRLD